MLIWNYFAHLDTQLKIEREAGRVFKGWKEGKIYFAPTYKYSLNSDIYAGETVETKSKRRTPSWYVYKMYQDEPNLNVQI